MSIDRVNEDCAVGWPEFHENTVRDQRVRHFAEAGGTGEVSAGLHRALRRRDIDIRVLLPAYPEVISKASDITVVAHLPGRAGIPLLYWRDTHR